MAEAALVLHRAVMPGPVIQRGRVKWRPRDRASSDRARAGEALGGAAAEPGAPQPGSAVAGQTEPVAPQAEPAEPAEPAKARVLADRWHVGFTDLRGAGGM